MIDYMIKRLFTVLFQGMCKYIVEMRINVNGKTLTNEYFCFFVVRATGLFAGKLTFVGLL